NCVSSSLLIGPSTTGYLKKICLECKGRLLQCQHCQSSATVIKARCLVTMKGCAAATGRSLSPDTNQYRRRKTQRELCGVFRMLSNISRCSPMAVGNEWYCFYVVTSSVQSQPTFRYLYPVRKSKEVGHEKEGTSLRFKLGAGPLVCGSRGWLLTSSGRAKPNTAAGCCQWSKRDWRVRCGRRRGIPKF